MASFLGRLWWRPRDAFKSLKERPGLWQGLLILLLALNFVAFVLWMRVGPWAAYLQRNPIVLDSDPSSRVLVPASLDLQRDHLWWSGVTGLLLWMPVGMLIQGWIIWIAAQWLQRDPSRTYDHGMATLLGSRVVSLPIAATAAWLQWRHGSSNGVPSGGLSIGLGLKVSVSTLPQQVGLWGGPWWVLVLFSLPIAWLSWLSVRETLGVAGWRGVLLAALAL